MDTKEQEMWQRYEELQAELQKIIAELKSMGLNPAQAFNDASFRAVNVGVLDRD